jgi:NAD(P)-dependent dehydrogenase (short-subunit alcohol dehydrogenase family)
MPNILIVGATRGLGLSLAKAYASGGENTVYGTTRKETGSKEEGIIWVPNIDVSDSGVGARLVNQLGMLGVGGGMNEGGIREFDVVVSFHGWRRRMEACVRGEGSWMADYYGGVFRDGGFCKWAEVGGGG